MLAKLNYNINKTVYLDDGPVNGQGCGKVSTMRYGFFPMSYNGCEMIATYNLLLLEGRSREGHPLCEICREMYPQAWAFWGIFGSNVYVLDKYFKQHGIPCEKTLSLEKFIKTLDTTKYGIVSMWNAHHPFKGIHTVCVEKTEDGVRVYNRSNGRDYPVDYKSLYEVVDKPRFMCGYYLVK